jgi:hypothetical protein
MGTKNKYGHNKIWPRKRRKNDGGPQGVQQTHIDGRVAYIPENTGWHNKIQIIGDEPMIAYSDVEDVLCENEDLRDTLFANQNVQYNRVIAVLMSTMNQSTSNINNNVREISAITQTLSEREVFHIIYMTLDSYCKVDWTYVKKGESKLQYCMRTGVLPIVSIITDLLLRQAQCMFTYNFTEAQKFFKAVAKKAKPKKSNQVNHSAVHSIP